MGSFRPPFIAFVLGIYFLLCSFSAVARSDAQKASHPSGDSLVQQVEEIARSLSKPQLLQPACRNCDVWIQAAPPKPQINSPSVITLSTEELLRNLRGTEVRPEVVYLPSSSGGVCPQWLISQPQKWFGKDIVSLAKEIKFDPKCISNLIKTKAQKQKEPIEGFAFGAELAASVYVGYQRGTELVMMRYGPNMVMLGQVKYDGGGGSLSLSGGALTQSVIYGNCQKGVLSYLGRFNSFAVAAVNHNFGMRRPAGWTESRNPGGGRSVARGVADWEMTACNSTSVIQGTSSPAVSAAMTFYEPVGNFVLLKGPGVQPILDYLDDLNRGKR